MQQACIKWTQTSKVKLESINACCLTCQSCNNLDLALIPVTYIVFPTTGYNENLEQQHTNCSNISMQHYTVLLCGEGSILGDGNKGSIDTQDGLQTSELQQFFIWNVGYLNTIPFLSIIFENKIIPHSIDFYFHFSPQDLKINIPKITLYWSNKNPLDSEHILPFQRMAYLVGNGMYKYRTILEINGTNPFSYIRVKMEPMEIYSDNWIFLSEIKVYAKKTEGTEINMNYVDLRK